MKSIKKFFKSLFKKIIGFLITILVLATILYFSAGSLVQHFAPAFISQLTKTESSLGKVDLSLFSGRITINDLAIGNPAGYKNKNALELGKFDVQFDPKSILTEKIIIKNVQVSGLTVSSEAKANGETNITRLRDNISSSLNQDASKDASSASKAPTEQPKEPASSKGQKSVVIKDLVIDNSSVNVALSGIPGLSGAALATTVPLPDIHMKDIGENKKQTLGETVLQILNVINSEVIQASAKAVRDASEKVIQSGKDSVNTITNTIKSFF